MENELPLLYNFRRCPYAIRARLALSVSGQACIVREIELRDRPEELYVASPKGTVPVLVLADGRVLEESLEVMEWTLGNQDPEGWQTVASRTEMHELIAENDADFKFHLDRYKYSNRYEQVDSGEHREKASVFLKRLDARLNRNNYLCASRLGLADVAIAPFVRQFAFADRPWFDAQSWIRLRAWLDAFTESARFARIMEKRAIWQAGSEPVTVQW